MARAVGLLIGAVLAGGCGRLGFEPSAGDGGVPSDGSGSGADGGDAASAMACPLVASGSCPQTAGALNGGERNESGNTAGKGDALAGSCGGANAEEHTVELLVLTTATYRFDIESADFDAVMYVREGGCDGVELACETGEPRIVLDLVAGQSVVVVVDGANGTCGNYQLRIRVDSS